MQSPPHSNESLRMMRRGGGEARVKVDVDESYPWFKACLKLNSSPFGLDPTFHLLPSHPLIK